VDEALDLLLLWPPLDLMTMNDSTVAILSERRWQCAVPRRGIGWVGQPLSLLALALWTSISSRGRGCRRLKTCVEAVERSSRVPKASGEPAGLCWMVLVERSGKPRSMPDTRQDDTLPLGHVCVPTCSHRPLELLPSSLFGLFLWYYIGLAWRSLLCQPMRWQNMG